jgi:pimeloyl-ACP methyl ester carboxylesterase
VKPWLALLLVLLLALCGCMSFHQGPMPGEPARAAFTTVNGVRLRVLDRGKGPPVVLLHGFASSLDAWADVVPALEPDHRVIALDLKGFGWSDRPEGDYSPAAQAEIVFALLDQLRVDRAAVVAHSWGASVALAMAMARPARVERLALYSAWVYEEQLPTTFLWARAGGVGELLFGLYYAEQADEKIALAFFDPKNVTEELVEDVEHALERPGATAAALAAVRGQRFEEMEARYPDVRQPTLILWGREDRVTPIEHGERLAAELPEAEMRVYPRCGHFPMIEAKNASTRHLRAFLAETALGSPPPRPSPLRGEGDPAPAPAPAPVPEPVPVPPEAQP